MENSDQRSKGSMKSSVISKSVSSTKRKVNSEQRLALMHKNISSQKSHIMQDELAESAIKRSNSMERKSKAKMSLLVPSESFKMEKMALSKDDHEVVESSSSSQSDSKRDKGGSKSSGSAFRKMTTT